MLSVAREKEIVIAFFFVGDFGWVRHLGVTEDNRGVAFLVFLYIEKGIFFHILSYIFSIECQIPVVRYIFKTENWFSNGLSDISHCPDELSLQFIARSNKILTKNTVKQITSQLTVGVFPQEQSQHD